MINHILCICRHASSMSGEFEASDHMKMAEKQTENVRAQKLVEDEVAQEGSVSLIQFKHISTLIPINSVCKM